MTLLLVVIAIMPLEFNPYLSIADSFMGIQDFTMIKLLGILGLGWALAKKASGEGGERLFESAQGKLFLVFYCGVLAAGILSGSGLLALQRYLAFLLFMPFVLVAVRTHADLRKVMYAIPLTYIAIFPYAVRQMFKYGGARLGTGLYETNYYAANVVLVIPLAFALARNESDPTRRRLWAAAGLVLVLALFLTASRGGFLGLLVAGLVYMYRRRGVAAAVGLVAILALAPFVLPTDVGERRRATFWGGSEPAGLDASNRAHMALFWAGVRMINSSPLTGVGPENFKNLSLAYSNELEQPYIAHNTYLELAAETGLPVLTIFLLLVWRALGSLDSAVRLSDDRDERELAGWAEGMRSGLIGFLVAGAFISAQYEKMFWLYVFLSIVVGRMVAQRSRGEAESRGPTVIDVPSDALGQPS